MGIVPILILAAWPGAPIDNTQSSAVDIFRCEFEAVSDVDFDHWPDRWTRERGRGFPSFVQAGIAQEGNDSENAALRIQLNGGAVALFSPTMEVSRLFSYVLEARLRTEGLKNDSFVLTLEFLDESGAVVESHALPTLTRTTPWQESRIGPLSPGRVDARKARIAARIVPGERADLKGEAWLDDVRVARMPRMTIRTGNPHAVYRRGEPIEVTCEVAGIDEAAATLRWELLDVDGQTVDRGTASLTMGLQASKTGPTGSRGEPTSRSEGIAGNATWRPRVDDVGFYRLRATLGEDARRTIERSTTIAVIDTIESSNFGEFGWSLPRGEEGFAITSLLGLLGEVGIHWLKFPAWFDEHEQQRAEQIAWFAERLGANRIEMIGLLDQPPASLRKLFRDESEIPIASLLQDPDLWRPKLDPVMTRLSLKVRWWQFGGDRDTSFVGFDDLHQRIGDIRRHLEKFGRDLRFGFAWKWLYEPPQADAPPWQFLSYTVTPSLTPSEVQAYLGDMGGDRKGGEEDGHDAALESHSHRRWLALEPLPKDEYGLPARAQDLVARMLAAKVSGADAAFVPDPLDPRTGLLNPDGTPGELLLPFRTTARLVSGTRFIGRIQLPNGSQNLVFQRGNEALLVVWNDQPTTEPLYLGDDVRQIDVWGRAKRPAERQVDDQVHQEIEVGPLPVFVTGAHLAIARWRMAFAFDNKQLANLLGKEQDAGFRFQNTFDRGVGGTVRLHAPQVWEVKLAQNRFRLAPDEEATQPLRVLLRQDASTGQQPVRVDFQITAERDYAFSVFSSVQVGLGDVEMDVVTFIDEHGSLVVEQVLTNKTDEPVSFNCLLFAPGHRRQRKQVFKLGRGRTLNRFYLPESQTLAGKTLWLRAEEIEGSRILNQHVAVPQ